MTDSTPARRLLHNAYRDLIVCLAAWLVTLIWTLSVYYLLGYRYPADHWLVRDGWVRPPDAPIGVILGVPDWVFHGIVIPWVASTVFTVVYVLFFMADDDLGTDPEESHDAA